MTMAVSVSPQLAQVSDRARPGVSANSSSGSSASGSSRHPPARAASSRLSCGVERWAVKTLADYDARKINFHPRRTTISTLRRLTPTHTYARGPGVERRTYRVRARLVEAKLEEDEDFHLVVADPRHHASGSRGGRFVHVRHSGQVRASANLAQRGSCGSGGWGAGPG